MSTKPKNRKQTSEAEGPEISVSPSERPTFDQVATGEIRPVPAVFDRTRPLRSAAKIILDKVGLGRP